MFLKKATGENELESCDYDADAGTAVVAFKNCQGVVIKAHTLFIHCFSLFQQVYVLALYFSVSALIYFPLLFPSSRW